MSTTTRILRWAVPVDDKTHTVPAGTGRVVHVDCRDPKVVDVWVETTTESTDPPGPAAPRAFLVLGTGHTYPPGATYVGTALTPAQPSALGSAFTTALGVGGYGELVWHVVEVPAP